MSAATVMPAASPRRAPRKKASAAAPPAMTAPSPAARTIPLALLDDHPDNPRAALTGIDELAATIAGDGGLLQALVVVPSHRLFGAGAVDDGRFTIVAGHRRRAAAALLGWTEVRCEVRDDLAARAVRGAMLTENLQRVDLTPLEEAEAFDKLVGDGWSQRDVAAAAGCTQGHVSKRLSLLRLEPTVQQAVRDGQLPVAEAVELGKLGTPRSQKRAYERMRGLHGYAVRDAATATRDERREVEREATFDQACAQVKASGWPRVTIRPSYSTAGELHRAPEQKAHQKDPLPCYAVYVESHGGVTHYCTKPKTHGKGASSSADPEAETRRERAKAIKTRTAAAARLERLRVAPAAVPAILARAAIGRLDHAASTKLACGWLRADGVDIPEDYFFAEKQIVAGTDEGLLIRFALAMILANREVHARWTHSRWQEQDLRYLHELVQRVQYEPTPWERARIGESGVLDVDAFLAAGDPRPHLPEQPTLHDDLGTEPATQPVERVPVNRDLL